MLRGLALCAAIATGSGLAACQGPPASPARITVSLGRLSFSWPKDVQSLEALLVRALERAADEVCVPMHQLEMAEYATCRAGVATALDEGTPTVIEPQERPTCQSETSQRDAH